MLGDKVGDRVLQHVALVQAQRVHLVVGGAEGDLVDGSLGLGGRVGGGGIRLCGAVGLLFIIYLFIQSQNTQAVIGTEIDGWRKCRLRINVHFFRDVLVLISVIFKQCSICNNYDDDGYSFSDRRLIQ